MKTQLIAPLVGLAVFSAQAVCAADTSTPLSRIAFGSCAKEDRPQPIWEPIAATDPDLFVFIGDNVYNDTTYVEVMKTKYGLLGAMEGYQKIKAACPILATWDDHDYGENDAGVDYLRRAESKEVFMEFFDIPATSPMRTREGIYDSHIFGPEGKRTQVILLDTRSFRTSLTRRPTGTFDPDGPYIPTNSDGATLLGEEQWQWLEGELRKPAELRIIASSIQVVAEDHAWEKWGNMPRERRRLYELVKETSASGVMFISGDRHLAELSMMDGGVGYPLYDLTSSGMNMGSKRWRFYEPNRHRVGTMNWGDNFGFIAVDWEQEDPLIRLQIIDEAGDINIQRKINLSTLQFGKIEPREQRR